MTKLWKIFFASKRDSGYKLMAGDVYSSEYRLFMWKKNKSIIINTIWANALMVLIVTYATLGFGQYGASPSQSGLFFDDLRNRANQSAVGSRVRTGEAVYDYQNENGSFTYAADGREMGATQSVAGMNEAARQMGQSAYRAGSGATAARAVGDYTYYSSQYSSPNTFFAPTYVSDPFLGGKRNLKLGGVNVGFGLMGSVEYNDNVTRSSNEPLEDIISTVLLNMDANYQVTQNNRLTITTSLGFDHYFNNPDVAYGSNGYVLNVLPGSSIAFDMKIGPVFVVIYDRFSARPAVQNEFALAANQIFGVMQNDAGLGARWDINSQLSLSFNYMHSNSRSYEEEFSAFDRDMDSVQGNLTWSPSGTWSLGIEGGMSWVRYPEGFNNDGVLANAGVVFSTPLGDSSFLRVGAGVQSFDFDTPPDVTVTESDVQGATNEAISLSRDITSQTAALNRLTPGTVEYEDQAEKINQTTEDFQIASLNAQTLTGRQQVQLEGNTQDTSDLSDYYFNLTLTNQLSSRVSQVVSLGHESALSNVANYITADYINYGIGIIAWRGSRLSVSAYYEDADVSGGRNGEDLTQYGIDTYMSHNLNSWCRAGVGFHYGKTDSGGIESEPDVDRDFQQFSYSADLSFMISRKASLSLGYRHFTTEGAEDEFSFEQNRFVMALNYNF